MLKSGVHVLEPRTITIGPKLHDCKNKNRVHDGRESFMHNNEPYIEYVCWYPADGTPWYIESAGSLGT